MSNNLLEDTKAPSPPPAPPLPPQRQGFVANALARVAQPFGYGSRPPSVTGQRPVEPRPSRLSVQRSSRWAPTPLLRSFFIPPKVPQVPQGSQEASTDNRDSPVSSRSTSHKTGIPIAALDVSPDRSHAVLAGHNILKTISVSDSACAEDFNLRTSVIAYTATHKTSGNAISAKHKDQLSVNDVKWSHGKYSTTIATAAANGQIVVYDINRTEVEMARLHEHNRQVHKLGFNPYEGALMLSGSQDGTVRLWDLRDLSGDRSVMTCQSRRTFLGNSEGIRDVSWCPQDIMIFAIGTDNGVIQRWDIRDPKNPLVKISAHEHKTCHSIDWHPDGKHLVSVGADKNIKVWDFTSSDRRKKHVWEIRAPQAVLNVRWRPPCWSSERNGPAKWQCTQVATSYDQQDPRIHIWDFRRPYTPFRTLDRYETPPSAVLWQSENTLWSVGSAGMFTQTDINFVPKTMDQRSPNTLAIASDSQVLLFSQKREQRRTSIEDVLDDLNHLNQRRSSTSERLGAGSSTGQGSSEEPSLLSSSFKNRQRRHPGSARSTRSLAGTPPSAGSSGSVLGLEKSLQANQMYRPSQVAAIGYVEGLFDVDAFRYLARNYEVPEVPTEDPQDECNLHTILGNAFRANSTFAARAGHYRLAQSWQVLALAVELELKKRAEDNYQKRTKDVPAESSIRPGSLPSKNEKVDDSIGDIDTEPASLNLGQQRAKVTAPSVFDNASNMTTPLARPVPDSQAGPSAPTTVESLQLPDATWSKQPVKLATGVSELAKMSSPKSLGKGNVSKQGKQEKIDLISEIESQPGESTYQQPQETALVDMDRHMVERRAAIGNYRAIPRPLLRLDDPIQMTSPGLDLPTFDRHDSNESFQLFSASTDSSRHGPSIMGSFESNKDSQNSTSTPDRKRGVESPADLEEVDPEEAVLVFDDEAELSSPRPTPASPPRVQDNKLPDQVVNGDEVHNPKEGHAPPVSVASYRPANSQQPSVHYEDFEHWLLKAEPLKGSMEGGSSDGSNKYILADYIPPEPKPESIPCWFASDLFEPLVDFHTYKLYDAQLPAYLLLHLARWLHHSIPYERATLIFLQYHRQLVDFELFVQAAELRNLAGYEFPEVAEYGLYGIASGGPWCANCQKASKGNRSNFCERCNEPWASCAICNGEGPILAPGPGGVCQLDENPKAADSLWTWCQDCGHGGHAGCLKVWWESEGSEGACPTRRCLHDCMPGARRDEIVKKQELERESRKPGFVTKDEWKIPESAAAQRARSLVGQEAAQGLGIGGGGRGATSLAAAGRSGSGKKVRIVVPEDEEERPADAGKGRGVEKTSASMP